MSNNNPPHLSVFAREVLTVCQGVGFASVPMIQRQLRIGYMRATGVVAELVEAGVIGVRGEEGKHPILR